MRGDRRLLALLSILPFCLLATANSAGYRYGASDLAFYGPAAMRAVDPQLFPRDTPLIDAQARLTLMDETVGVIARLTTGDFPTLFLGLYLLTLALLAIGATALGTRLYRHSWTTAALLAALSLRHAVTDSGTNTLEAYFHPRQLAFAFGAVAVAAFLRGHTGGVALGLLSAATLHPTTTLWFVVWMGVAMFVSEPRWRRSLGAAGAAALVVVVWAAAGPLRERVVIMDPEWLAAIADKDYLFPLAWPSGTWAINLGYALVIVAVYRWRAAHGLLLRRETGVVVGCLALVAVFACMVALHGIRLALAIQLQPARVFWMLDYLAIVYLVWAIAEGPTPRGSRARVAAFALIAIAAARGLYVMEVEFPDRPLFQVGVPGDWGRVTAWAQSTPKDSAWLADPAHASLYGTSVRMAARRDVFVEAAKDAAIGMYDRRIAMQTRDRLQAVGDFHALAPARARQLGADHGLDYLVTESDLTLPLAFQSGPIRVYRLR